MKEYLKPYLEEERIDIEDVITLSSFDELSNPDPNNDPDTDSDTYE